MVIYGVWLILILLYSSGSFSGGACSEGEHNPLPLMSKGESELVLLPSSPKGEIVGIMAKVLSLMATHSGDRS